MKNSQIRIPFTIVKKSEKTVNFFLFFSLQDTNVMSKAENFRGKNFLLMHGTADGKK